MRMMDTGDARTGADNKQLKSVGHPTDAGGGRVSGAAEMFIGSAL